MLLIRPTTSPRPGPTQPAPADAGRARDRLMWPDVAKGACIVLVVLWHVIWKHYELVHWDVPFPAPRGWGLLNDQLTPMRMPLFFTISGMFAVGALGRSWSSLLRSRLLRFSTLYVLWVLIETVVLGLTPDFRTAHATDPIQLAAELTISPTNLWYLLALALYFPLAKACRNVPTVWLLGAATVLAVAAAAQWIPNSGNRWQVLQNLVFFLAGSRLAPSLRRLAVTPARRRLALLIAGTISASALVAVLHAQDWPGLHTTMSALAAVTGICAAGAATRGLPRIAGLLAALGRRTLPVYVLHLPLLAVVDALVRAPLQQFAAHSALLAVIEPVLATALVITLSLAAHRLLLAAGLRRLFDPWPTPRLDPTSSGSTPDPRLPARVRPDEGRTAPSLPTPTASAQNRVGSRAAR